MDADKIAELLEAELRKLMPDHNIQVVEASALERLLAEDEEPSEEDIDREFTRRQTETLEGVRRQQANLLRVYDILRALEKSIATPRKERTQKHSLDEMLLAIDLSRAPK